MSFTRKQYMDKECSHRDYYGQFVHDGIKRRVLQCIGKERLEASTDEHLNDIPLKLWDTLGAVGDKRQWDATEGDWPSMAGRVCIYKEAARQIKEEWTSRESVV
jgi:hypothetical protein